MRAKRWTGFGVVLCAVDFSEPSRRALRYAAAVASRGDGRLAVLHVNDPMLIAAARAACPNLDLAGRNAKELNRFVREALGPRPPVGVDSLVATGVASDQIVAAAARARAGLIVLGAHGLTGTARLIVGSTALAVLKRAHVPVLAIPASGKRSRDVRWWPHGRLLAAVDLDERTPGDVHTAARVAEWFGCALMLVHVVADPGAPAWLHPRLTVHEKIRVARARERLRRAAVRSGAAGAAVRVRRGRPAEGIAAIADRERAALLVTVLRDRRTWFGGRRASVTYRVLAHARVPILACPPRWRPR